jgi:hypothetical protein
LCAGQQGGSKVDRAIVVAVQKEKNSSLGTGPATGQLDDPLQLPGFEKPVPRNPQRLFDMYCEARPDDLCEPSYEERDRVDFSVALDDADQSQANFSRKS